MATKTGITTGYNITALSRINGTPTRTSFTTSRLESNLSGDNTAEVSIDIDESTIEYGTITSITINYSTRSSNTFWSAPTPRTGYINNSGGYTWVRDHYCESAKVNDNPKPFNDTITNPTRSNNGHYRFLLGGVNEIPAAYLAWIEFTSISLNITYTPHTHNWTSTGKTEPTCTATGSESFKCSICGATKTETIPAKGHTPGAAATCTTPQKCTVCGATLANALGHSFGSTTYTWSADGKSCTAQRVCSRDSSHKETSTATITSAVKTAATCTVKGTTTYTAKFSVSWATTQTKDVQDISAKGHTWVAANCTTPKTCSVCGATEGSALGHNYVGAVTKQPTCTEKGVKTYTCQNDSSHKYTEEIPAKGHTSGTAVIENRIEATCTTAGSYDEVVYCTVCGAELSRTKVTVPKKGHSYTSETFEPTENSHGYTRYTCSVCGHSYDTDYTCRLKIEVENGTVEGVVDGGIYAKDSQVWFTAIPDEGYEYRSAVVYYPDGAIRSFPNNTGRLNFLDNITFVVTFKPILPEITSVTITRSSDLAKVTINTPVDAGAKYIISVEVT